MDGGKPSRLSDIPGKRNVEMASDALEAAGPERRGMETRIMVTCNACVCAQIYIIKSLISSVYGMKTKGADAFGAFDDHERRHDV